MADDIYNDILFRLRVPLPYELRGLTVQDLITERKDAADEIERLERAVARLKEIIHDISPDYLVTYRESFNGDR